MARGTLRGDVDRWRGRLGGDTGLAHPMPALIRRPWGARGETAAGSPPADDGHVLRCNSGLRLSTAEAAVSRPHLKKVRGRGLIHMHEMSILIRMRTTLNIDDQLLEKARRLSGLKEKTAVVHAGLEALIARESARRLSALGGSEKGARSIRRRRSRKVS